MNNYFKDRMDEIELRTEHMAERKKYELEIESLEEKLRGFESSYERLKTSRESNLEMLALKRVDLVLAKEAQSFAEDMLTKKEGQLAEEKRKLDDLHRKVWEEERKACDEVDKCLLENDSVGFLNDYPLVLKTGKYAYNATPESEEEIRRAVAEHPEVGRLRAEVAALEMESRKYENTCSTGELQNLLTQVDELNRRRKDEGDEIQRLIDALERSHRERIALEAEIADVGSRKPDALCGKPKLSTSQKDSRHICWIKNESQRTSSVGLVPKEEKWIKNKPLKRDNYGDDEELKLDNHQDKKLKAKKWYEEYTRSLGDAGEENSAKNYCPTPSQLKREVEDDIWERKFSRPSAKRSGKFLHSSQPVKSRFFEKKEKNPNPVGPGLLTIFGSNGTFEPKNEVVDVDPRSEENSEADRKFEPLMATPRTSLDSVAAETAVDNYSVQSTHGHAPSTAVQDILKVKKTVKFTPKRPSNIRNGSSYRQTKLDDFTSFMLSDGSKYAMQEK